MNPKPPRAWARMPSGMHFDLLNPDPNSFLDSDLVRRLSRTYRWGGESKWPLPLSVAQHALTVLELRRQWSIIPLSPIAAFCELNHDSDEALAAHDCISPLKVALGERHKEISARLLACVWAKYQLPPWEPEVYAIHKRADVIAAASEAVHCVGWSRDEVRDILEIQAPILETDPLVKRYGGTPWEPWAPEVAEQRFGAEMKKLMHEISLERTAVPLSPGLPDPSRPRPRNRP